jgi:hypothetical protein
MADVASADGLIACFDAKYHYLFWRPIHAIARADTDGNPATEQDPTWIPLVATPNHPEYPSAHACASGALLLVLASFFGTQEVPFSVDSAVTHTTPTNGSRTPFPRSPTPGCGAGSTSVTRPSTAPRSAGRWRTGCPNASSSRPIDAPLALLDYEMSARTVDRAATPEINAATPATSAAAAANGRAVVPPPRVDPAIVVAAV